MNARTPIDRLFGDVFFKVLGAVALVALVPACIADGTDTESSGDTLVEITSQSSALVAPPGVGITTDIATMVDGAGNEVPADPAAVTAYWTAERIAQAEPADTSDVHGGESPPILPTGPAGTVAPAAPSVLTEAVGNGASLAVAEHIRTAGRVFFKEPGTGKSKTCSASALNSPSRMLVLTAGHCVTRTTAQASSGWNQQWVFVPDFNGNASAPRPFGTFAAKRFATFNSWKDSRDVSRDVAVVTVWPNESGQKLVDLVGGNGLAWNYSSSEFVAVVGYPSGAPFDGRTQQFCRGLTSQHHLGSRIDLLCNLTVGASGGPWLKDFDGNLGKANGVTSQGDDGYTISPYFDTWVHKLYLAHMSDT